MFRKYCYECSPKTNNPSDKFRAMKKQLVKERGGGCQICGYNKSLSALQFHHKDPKMKQFQISNSGTGNKSFDKIRKEAQKCILICANCHAQLHDQNRQIITKDNGCSKKVIDVDTGQIWDSVTQCALYLDVAPAMVSSVCRNKKKQVKGRRIQYCAT